MSKKIEIKTVNHENSIWGFLQKEIWLIGVVIGAVLAIYIPMSKIQTDIATIQTNHEAHMQSALEKIASLEEKDIKQDEQIQKLLEAVVENQTLIKTHMNIK